MAEFKRMDTDNPLVIKFKQNKNVVDLLRNNKDINFEIRSNSINLYYNMHNFMKLKYVSRKRNVPKDKSKGLFGQIHHKYLPVIFPIDYVDVSLEERVNLLPYNNVDGEFVHTFNKDDNVFSQENIIKVKKRIDVYAGEEKKYQSKIIMKNRTTVLDAEIAFNEKKGEIEEDEQDKDSKNIRIDLMNFDKNIHAITAIELKLLGDPRLENDEIISQLIKYKNFMKNHKDEIETAYKHVYRIKRDMGILKENKFEGVLINPILVIVCFSERGIKSLLKKDILSKVKEHVSALFLFANYGDLNILERNQGYKYVCSKEII